MPTAMRSSRSCFASTGEGAPVIRSTAAAVFGNAITSRIEVSPASMRTMPIEPEGDAAVRRRAVLERVEEEPEPLPRLLVADAQQPEDPSPASAVSWIRMLPPPISQPFSTRSYACARTRPGSVSSSGSPRRAGAVNGWCIESPALLLLVPLEQREIHDPGERELVGRQQAQLPARWPAAAAPAASRWHRPGRPRAAAGRPARGARRLEHAATAVFADGLERRALDAPSALRRTHTSPRAPSCLGLLDQLVELAARRAPGARHDEARAPRPPLPTPRGTARTPSRGTGPRRPRSACRTAGPACRIRTAPSPPRTACGGNGAATSTPISREDGGDAAARSARRSVLVANDISTSTCVNSGWRSARRSSSRKHRAIWK